MILNQGFSVLSLNSFEKHLYKSLLFALLLVAISTSKLQADISLTAPAANTKIASCDDFATQMLLNPWDMSDSGDINNFYSLDVKDLMSKSFSGGNFNAITESGSSSFFLFSPMACGSYPIAGRWGQNYTVDTSKYTRLSLHMYTDVLDSFGFRMIWNRSCDYSSNRTVTVPSPTKTGWHTYTVDLTTIGNDGTGDTSNWSAGSITGLAILPTTQAGANVKIDSIRLEDPNSCGTGSVSYNATTTSNNNLHSVWLDTDLNPFNGYVKQLATAQANGGVDSENFNTLGMAPGNYNVIGLAHSDYKTLEGSDPWDFNESTDILTTANINGASLSGGTYSGTAASGSPTIYLRLTDGGIDASKYSKFTMRLTRSGTAGGLYLIWTGSAGDGSKFFSASDVTGDNLFQADLSLSAGWSGTINSLIIRPSLEAGSTFSLDWVSLRSSGFDTTLSSDSLTGNIQTSAGDIVVNSPPSIEITHPSNKGGEALKAWNMNDGDFDLFDNLSGESDPTYTSETLTTYLPDVRTIDGLRGDFFKGTNQDGDFDPVNYSTYEFATTPITFDASTYKNLCFKMLADGGLTLATGSVARVFWLKDGETSFHTSEDIVHVADGWSSSRWTEYCVDLTKLYVDGTTSGNWDGTIKSFRIDAHESTAQASYYFDYIKLRKDEEASGAYTITFNLQDSDDAAATVSLYYTTNTTATGGTLITTLPEGNASYTWNTSGIAAGSYLVYAIATDTQNTVTYPASARLTISNSGGSNEAPILSLEAPSANQVVCSTLQIKGFALQPDPTSTYRPASSVEVSVDGSLFAVVDPTLYSKSAKESYPIADSSNSGFNSLLDFSAYTNTTHTVTVTARAANGQSAQQSFTVNKQATGCADPITDPDPSGVAIPVTNVSKPTTTLPKISKLSHKSDGTFSITISSIGDESCALGIYGGSSSSTVTTSVKSFNVTSSMARKNKVTLKAKVKIGKKEKAYFKILKRCDGYDDGESSAKKLKVGTQSGSKLLKVFSTLTKKLKASK